MDSFRALIDVEAHIRNMITGEFVTTGNDRYIVAKLNNPNALVSDDSVQGIIDVTPAALTISKITVSLRTTDNEIAGDLKYADALIGLATPILINPFDTSSGILSDDSITAGAVPAGKVIYLDFDSIPDEDITQILMMIHFTFD